MKKNKKRLSKKQIRTLFPRYKNIDECPDEYRADYLCDLARRIEINFDIKDFVSFMQAVGN